MHPSGASASEGSATTISEIPAARMASSDHSSIGRPATSTKAFGTEEPSREPLPAATSSAIGPDAPIVVSGPESWTAALKAG